MQWLYDVHGDHPVLKRVDELQLTEVEKNDLVAELKKFNYDNIEVNKDIYLEDGDEIDITSHTVLSNKNEEAKRLLFSIIIDKASNLGMHDLGNDDMHDLGDDVGYDPDKLEEAYIYQLCPLKLTLNAVRADRKRVYLQAEWDVGNGKKRGTNLYGLQDIGFKFIEPESEEIPLMNADDDILYEYELVIKYYALQNQITEEEARVDIEKVQNAMGHSGIIFYRP
jgi:hypothetical protein